MIDKPYRKVMKYVRGEGWQDSEMKNLKDGDLFRLFDVVPEEAKHNLSHYYIEEEGMNLYLAVGEPFLTVDTWGVEAEKVSG